MIYRKITFYTSFLLILLVGCASSVVRKDAQTDTSANDAQDEILVIDPENDLDEVLIKKGEDVFDRFREISQMTKIKKINFEPGDYIISKSLELPRTKTGGLIIINGQGANLKAKAGVEVFRSIPKDQSQAMIWNKTRYLIENFGSIQGGSRGVFIGSSFNTVIRNIEFIGQSVAAIDLVFCLMSTIENILVTNVGHDGIVLRSAVDSKTMKNEWPGTSFNNSQCNHSVVRSCRVYNKKGCTGTSFKVLQSTGVRLLDCISEGWENEHAVFFDAEKCTTAKFFSIENFHLEHMPTNGALVFRSNGSIVNVDGLFLQTGSKTSPAIWLMNNGNYIFKNIPWWPEGAWVKSSNSPYVVIEQSRAAFADFKKNWVNAEKPGQPIYQPYLDVKSKLVR